MAIAWSDDLSTGIDVIDNQHQRIVEYINQMERAIQTQDRQAVGLVLDELVDYSLSHFAFEESLQEDAGYRFAKAHKSIHEMFVKRLATYQAKYNAGEDIAMQLLGMLSTWLLHHIKRDDMAYIADVKANINGIVRDRKEGSWVSRSLARFFR
ncbi:MAG: bacteriohemerythrin [Sulfuritalea sp.]|nr:bacteriohemerythrin [Sulfuritalea sp.]